jgi:hypothetical protein
LEEFRRLTAQKLMAADADSRRRFADLSDAAKKRTDESAASQRTTGQLISEVRQQVSHMSL